MSASHAARNFHQGRRHFYCHTDNTVIVHNGGRSSQRGRTVCCQNVQNCLLSQKCFCQKRQNCLFSQGAVFVFVLSIVSLLRNVYHNAQNCLFLQWAELVLSEAADLSVVRTAELSIFTRGSTIYCHNGKNCFVTSGRSVYCHNGLNSFFVTSVSTVPCLNCENCLM